MTQKAKNIVKVGVTPYVKRYIEKTYGPTDHYFLCGSARNDLRVSLLNLSLTATAPLPAPSQKGCFLRFALGNDEKLWEAWEQAQPWLQIRAFYEYEFQLILRKYIEAQTDLANMIGLTDSQYSGKTGLELFLSKYGIEEWEYSYESLRRQWNRIRQKDLTAIEEKCSMMFDFAACKNSDNQAPPFRPARLIGGQQKRVLFFAWSRSEARLVERKIYVPATVIREGYGLQYAQIVSKVINGHLAKGCTIR